MSRNALLIALVLAVFVFDNVLLFSMVMRNRALEQRVETLQLDVARYITASDGTVNGRMTRRGSSRLVHEGVVARFLALSILLSTDAHLPLTPDQVNQVMARFRPHIDEFTQIRRMDETLANELRPMFSVLSPEQQAWMESHAREIQQKSMEVMNASRHDASLSDSFVHFWEQPTGRGT